MTLLHDLVACSEAVGATRSRKLKAEALAQVLSRLVPGEVTSAVGFLIGQPQQGKIGVGWATLADVSVAAAQEPTLQIADIDGMLDEVAGIGGDGSQGERRAVLAAVLERATADEADFIRRLLLGEMRQGALAGLMVDGLAKASGMPAAVIRRAAMLTGDLAVVAEVALTSDRAAVEAIGLEVMRPLQPMLASTAPDTATAISEVGEASVEWKLDGIRIQVHRSGDDVRIVTRNLNEVTGRLPGLVELVRALPAESLVLDGEALVMSGDGPDAFQDTASTFSRESDRESEESRSNLDVRFFDLLHRDGRDLIDSPLVERRAQLGEVAPDLLIPGVITAEPSEAAQVFADAIAAGHEGVMVKAADSPYEAGRRGKSWRKVKPVHTFDLVVLAAEWGHGRRQGWLSNLHLGARDPAATSEGDRFVMVGKTFKGLTDELLIWQTERFQQIAERHERGAVFVRPEIVVEIALDGVQRSTRYGGGVALRFARVRRYREDKEPSDADTIESLRALLG